MRMTIQRREIAYHANLLAKAIDGRQLEAVAAACERSVQTIRNWLAGRSEPNASDLAAIANLTGKPVEFFFARPRRKRGAA